MAHFFFHFHSLSFELNFFFDQRFPLSFYTSGKIGRNHSSFLLLVRILYCNIHHFSKVVGSNLFLMCAQIGNVASVLSLPFLLVLIQLMFLDRRRYCNPDLSTHKWELCNDLT